MLRLVIISMLVCGPAFAQGASIEMQARVETNDVTPFVEQTGEAIADENGVQNPKLGIWKGKSKASCRLIRAGRDYMNNNFAKDEIEHVVESCSISEQCICHGLGEWPVEKKLDENGEVIGLVYKNYLLHPEDIEPAGGE